MRDIVLSTAVDSFGKNWEPDLYNDMYFAGGKRGADFGVIFDLLLDRKVIRPGLRFECAHCASYEWYHVSEFTEEFACRYCFTSNRVPFASAREWQYKADGLFQVRNSALGSLGVILLLWRLAEVGRLSDHRYLSSVELEDSTSGKQYEVDCAVLKVATFSSSYDLVLGQATGFLDVTSDDVRKMREVADRFDKRVFLAFATLKDSYSAEEKKTLLSLDEDGYKLIALTRRELDPYDLFDRFKEATHPHAVGFSELSTNTIELNLRAGAVVS